MTRLSGGSGLPPGSGGVASDNNAGMTHEDNSAAARARFEQNLREITPADRDPPEFAREFLDRYMAHDERVIGVRFGPATIAVQVTDRAAAEDLPAAFHGVPVVLEDFHSST
jgi:hypothetical protein